MSRRFPYGNRRFLLYPAPDAVADCPQSSHPDSRHRMPTPHYGYTTYTGGPGGTPVSAADLNRRADIEDAQLPAALSAIGAGVLFLIGDSSLEVSAAAGLSVDV